MNRFQRKKDLILSTISDFGWQDVDLFLKSLEKTGFKGETVLFIENIDEETQSKIKDIQLDIRLIPFQRAGPETDIAIIDYRHLLYDRFLNQKPDRYSNIFISDVRDVFFLTDPFQCNWSPDSITVAKEALLIHQEPSNQEWILKKFGEQIYEEIKDFPVICAGTTFGPARSIRKYLKTMLHYIFETGYVGWKDQAVHNYLIHTGRLHPVAYADNENGPILTLGVETDIVVNGPGDTLLLKNGDPAPIVHQYDRHPLIVELFRYKAYH